MERFIMKKTIDLSQEQIEVLKNAISHGNLDIDEVRNQNNAMKRIEILKAHENFCRIWQASDGRWKTKLPDESKKSGCRLLAKSSRENLENAVIEHYKLLESDKRKESVTLATLYPIWREQQINKGLSSRTIRILDENWKKYYENDNIVNQPIKNLTVADLEDWCNSLINKNHMNKQKYYNVTRIIRDCFRLSYKKGLISTNVFQKIEIDPRIFTAPPIYKDKDRVFLKSEQDDIKELALVDFSENDSLACLGIILCFEIGTRLGELVALKWLDIDYNIPDHICIQRMESKAERTDAKGNYLPAERIVVNHTKTQAGLRDVFLSPYARKLLEMARHWHTEHHIESEYIFVNKSGQRLYSTAFDSRIEKYCSHLGIKTKRMHSIRRTYISKLFDGDVNISTIQQMCGHADKQTTLRNYVYDQCDLSERNAKIEQALRS